MRARNQETVAAALVGAGLAGTLAALLNWWMTARSGDLRQRYQQLGIRAVTAERDRDALATALLAADAEKATLQREIDALRAQVRQLSDALAAASRPPAPETGPPPA